MSQVKIETIDAETAKRFNDVNINQLGIVFYLSTLLVVYLAFKNIVPEDKLKAWTAISLGVTAISFVYVAGLQIYRPSLESVLKLWVLFGRGLALLYDLVTIAAIFLLLPYADDPRIILFTAYCIGYVPSQILSDPENTVGNQISTVGILGAFALQMLIQPGWHTDVLAGLVVAYGIVMVIAARSLRNIVREAVGARHEVEQTAVKLELALASVSAERDARTKFLAAASHDLGQPLHATTLFLEGAIDSKTVSERLHNLERASKANANARSMVGDMLNYARLEADAVQPNLQRISLGEVLSDVCELFVPLARQSGMTLVHVASSKHIVTDDALVKRAVSNLLANAISHSQRSKVLVGVRSSLSGRVRIMVLDNGIGIAANEVELIFAEYYQSSLRSGKFLTGFGLGLASVRRITALLNGSIDLKMLRYGGLCFTVDLPYYQ